MWIALAACGLLAVLFSVCMTFQRSLYGSAFCLMGVLLQMGILYFLMGAHVLGLLQVLVYAGAVMVLIVMAIMATPPRLPQTWASFHMPRWLIGIGFAAAASEAALVWRACGDSATRSVWIAAELESAMAALLFGRYALMTEAVGVIILLSALAAVQDEKPL
ncbi:MAG: NADH-quinone oxidoreductase subunit J [Elusimicrobia bacterium]|nr:NADH-quinone oxidoreductase subunit J [Elusimicrobiota bacterium]